MHYRGLRFAYLTHQKSASERTTITFPLHTRETIPITYSNPNTMSFGFGVGDFLAVGRLVWDVYRAYADAPEQFRNVSQEILSLHVVFGKVEDQLHNQGYALSAKDMDDLKILYNGLKTVMEELDALLNRYQSLSGNRIISFGRLKWGQEDLIGLRDKLRSNVTLLTVFNSSLARYVPFFLSIFVHVYLQYNSWIPLPLFSCADR